MAKSKKKPTAQNIAFIERIQLSIKENARKRMLKRAPKPAGINTSDILNQQYLLQRTLAQRIQPQPQQQSQTVNVYLAELNKLQQQETLKRIDEDASAAIIRQQRGGINQERLNFVLSSLVEQKQQVKKQPPPESFEYGFIQEGAVEYKQEERAKSVAALERLNKGSGPRSVAFESVSLLPPPRSSISEHSRRRAITPEQRRSISVEASERASILSKMTAEEFREKYPDLTGEIMRQSAEDTKKKYVKRRAEINAQIQEGSITRDDGLQLLKDFAFGIGYDVKPRLKDPPVSTKVEITPTFSASQERDFPKTTAVMKKKSQTSTEQLNASISANIKPSVFSETAPSIGGGGIQSAVIQSAKAAGTLKKSGRQMAARLVDPSQPSILQSFSKVSSAAQDLEEIGGSSPVEPTPPSSRPSTAGSLPKTGESFTRPGLEIVSGGILPRLAQ